jgi:hypothetical protein
VRTAVQSLLVAGAFVGLAGVLDRAAGAADALQLQLAGVILVEGKVEKALLVERTLTGGQPVMVGKGDRIGPYRLVKVFEDRVVLARGNQELTIRLGASAQDPSRREAATEGPSPGAIPPAPRPDAGVRSADQNPDAESARAERRQRKRAERRGSRSANGSKGASTDSEPAAPSISSE